MKTICKPGHPVPYSLHDMRVGSIALSDGQLTLGLDTGLVRIAEPCIQVKGRVVLTGVESCEVWRLSPNGRYGKFSGKKQTWQKFSRKHPEFSFEVIDELYGYNQVRYEGFLSLPGDENLTEFCMSVYYTGELIYETDAPPRPAEEESSES